MVTGRHSTGDVLRDHIAPPQKQPPGEQEARHLSADNYFLWIGNFPKFITPPYVWLTLLMGLSKFSAKESPWTVKKKNPHGCMYMAGDTGGP